MDFHRCPKCRHWLGPHLRLGADNHGGIVLCPRRGCQCYATWMMPGVEEVAEPPRDVVEQLRDMLQPTAKQERHRKFARGIGALYLLLGVAVLILTWTLDWGHSVTVPDALYILAAGGCAGLAIASGVRWLLQP